MKDEVENVVAAIVRGYQCVKIIEVKKDELLESLIKKGMFSLGIVEKNEVIEKKEIDDTRKKLVQNARNLVGHLKEITEFIEYLLDFQEEKEKLEKIYKKEKPTLEGILKKLIENIDESVDEIDKGYNKMMQEKSRNEEDEDFKRFSKQVADHFDTVSKQIVEMLDPTLDIAIYKREKEKYKKEIKIIKEELYCVANQLTLNGEGQLGKEFMETIEIEESPLKVLNATKVEKMNTLVDVIEKIEEKMKQLDQKEEEWNKMIESAEDAQIIEEKEERKEIEVVQLQTKRIKEEIAKIKKKTN